MKNYPSPTAILADNRQAARGVAYRYGLALAKNETRMMKTFYQQLLGLLAFVILWTLPAQAQELITTGGKFDVLKDRYGGSYYMVDLHKPMSTQVGLCSTAGYFNVYYETGCGIGNGNATEQARMDALCAVLSEVSTFMPAQNQNVKVNLWIRNWQNVNTGNGSVAQGSAFYSFPSGLNIGGILDGAVWQTINSGQDAYTDYMGGTYPVGNAVGDYYHGWLAFDFSQSFHTNLGQVAGGSEYDLYTVMLKEVSHVLGFASLWSTGGQSVFGSGKDYYTRYDLTLKDSANQVVLTPNTNCTMYVPTPVNGAIPDFSGYQTWSSHNLGETQRYFPQWVAITLSDLEYLPLSTYGNVNHLSNYNYNVSFNQDRIAGSNDGILNDMYIKYRVLLSSSIDLNPFLTNDVNATGFECLESMYGLGIVNVTAGTTTTSVTYTSSGLGLDILRYIPTDANGKKGNISYIIVHGYDTPMGQACSGCNHITDSEFNSFSTGIGCGNIGSGTTSNEWGILAGTPNVYSDGCLLSGFDIPPTISPNFLALWDGNTNFLNQNFVGLGPSPDGTIPEGIVQALACPLIPGVNYDMSLFSLIPDSVITDQGASLSNPAQVSVWANTYLPFVNLTNFNITSPPVGLIQLDTTITTNGPNPNGMLWQEILFNFIPDSAYINIYIVNENLNSYVFIDNVNLVPTNEPEIADEVFCPNSGQFSFTVQFEVPLDATNNPNVVDDYIETETFIINPSTPGLITSLANGLYQINTNVPSGVYTVFYTMTDYLGCVRQDTFTITLHPTLSNPGVLCSSFGSPLSTFDLSLLLNPQPSGGTFSGNAVSGNIFTPTTAGNYSITYIVQQGCSTNITLTVQQIPTLTNPGILCSSLGSPLPTFDLSQLLNPQPSGGTFSGNAVSGNIFTPTIPGNYTINYGVSGCSTSITLTVQQQPTLTTPNLINCPYETGIIDLDTATGAQPTGGLFGPAPYIVFNNPTYDFVMNQAGIGVFPFTYTLPSSPNCAALGTITVPDRVIVDFDSTHPFCLNGGPYDLTVFLNPVVIQGDPNFTGTYSGPGVVANIFTPASLGLGLTPIYYTGTDVWGCEYTFTIDVLINDCCDGPTPQYIPIGSNGTVTTVTDAIGNFMLATAANSATTTQLITISGILEVNINYTFGANSDIILCPGAQIVVNPNRKLAIVNGSVVRGNGVEMWKSITVMGDGSLTLNNAFIQDGEYAVELLTGSSAVITQTGFDRNYVGIYTPAGTNTVNQGQFWGNTFECTAPLSAPYSGQSGWQSISRAGIMVNDVALFRGYASFLPTNPSNIFRDMQFGIMGFRVPKLIVENCLFNDIPPVSAVPNANPHSGAGVYASESRLFVTGFGYQNTIMFDNCDYGVVTELGEHTFVNGCRMTNIGEAGVFVHKAQTGDVDISVNSITGSRNGIDLRYNESALSVSAGGNQITLNAPPGGSGFSGIRVIENGAIPVNTSILANTITLNPAQYGIELQTTYASHVSENNIFILQNPPTTVVTPAGIHAQGSTEPYICGNSIQFPPGSNPTLNACSGIYIDRCTDSRIHNNSTNLTNVGIRFTNICQNTDLASNSFGSHFIGLQLDASAIIGPQVNRGNMWTGIYGMPPNGAAALHFSPNASTWGFSKITTESPMPSIFRPLAALITPLVGWWSDNGVPDASIACSSSRMASPSFLAHIAENDTLIAGGEIPVAVYPEESNVLADQTLYERMAKDEDFTASGTDFEAFYTENTTSIAGELYGIVTQQDYAFTPEGLAQMQREGYLMEIEAISDSLRVLDSLQVIFPEDSSFLSLRTTLNAELTTIHGLYRSITEALNNTKYSNIDLISADNSGIIATEVYDLNTRIVNEIYLSTLAKGITTFSYNQQMQLENIAFQCPLTGGPAVFRARGLYHYIVPEETYNDAAACNLIGFSLRKPPQSKGFLLSPNPAKAEIQLSNQEGIPFSGRVEIYTVLGEKVIKKDLSEPTNAITISIADLVLGVYFCRLYTGAEESPVFIGKFIKMH